MGIKTFKGGIHPGYMKKLTKKSPIIKLEAGRQVVIPLQQHIGKICDPLVNKGDYVKVGQIIGDVDAYVSSPVHSSVSGTVVAVEPRLSNGGVEVNSVVIENDGEYIEDDTLNLKGNYEEMSREELIETIRKAGIVGMGGAGFPMHIKLDPKDRNIKYIILNGAECEPYLSSDHRTMMEHADEMIFGINVMMKILGARRAFIGVEDNKPDVIGLLLKKGLPYQIEVVPLETKYPQGSEKHLIKAITEIEVPHGKLPADVGVVVNNIDTCISLYNALVLGKPLYRRRVTVSGKAVKNPGVYDVPVGMSFREVFEAAGGFTKDPKKIIMGGPMMGAAQISLDVPIVKTTSGILAFTEKEGRVYKESPCLKCGKCVDVCPMNLMPYVISKAARNDDIEKAARYHASDCIECGSCSYTCPSHRYLVEGIRLAKTKVTALEKSQKR
ncbi:MAG: electron transport complex subunit RsxC [Clostridia bacterium]|nr:electron transport complex subunit RsxC [Clostridia bacterium]